jgi:hypothetical protein
MEDNLLIAESDSVEMNAAGRNFLKNDGNERKVQLFSK